MLLLKQAQPFKPLELVFLSVFILIFPSLEAWKKIFLLSFVNTTFDHKYSFLALLLLGLYINPIINKETGI
jgi:hypothetical protein